ncbi:Uncharacterized protein FWK35_00001902 [Aphis craccivora]|uniref:Uncharacterized protein n=1 Tax=Aphis craccivora TaxID=307492 RepID=A0A6G0ZNS4_APHCR|nr:Uncharacterized protein FWK35_00001902 [Aphis craccivora]
MENPKVSQNLKFVILIHGDHINHESLQEETITKQKVMSVLKRKATTDFNAKPNKLIRQELRSCQDSEAKAMIYECKTDYFSNGEQFCFMESIEYDQ